MEKETTNVLIIGSGPAGYTAAIYASRAGLNPILYQGSQPGGQLTITTEVENFPGYPNGITGPEMMEQLKSQAERFGTDLRYGMVTSVDFSSSPHLVTIDGTQQLKAKTVIIATGASAKWLGLESEQRLNGRGVSACAVCDGFFFRGQTVAIVGGGDTAAEEACYLANLCKKVYLIVRRDELRASEIMQKRVKNTANIEILWNSETVEILGKEEVEGVKLINTISQKESEISVSGFFVAIGHQPNTSIFKEYLALDSTGYIEVIKGSSKTNVAGVFACGDAQDKEYRQAITAAGSGCMAALDAERFLANQTH
ncbi:thioredoxin reductase (NADPH) [Arcicella aurantiaca]|uniref:Thioredoxin reductase n=1 Tax=Arcicella aurantiaca TaxID=591202 RepID=A0A316DPR5_9BACT|nr:thioredoxin-disulfide reductase [Arcicella aurantiaca]PWK20071.1 thioredoxin reductase (NADPH) [Arcicella aurantiaca]